MDIGQVNSKMYEKRGSGDLKMNKVPHVDGHVENKQPIMISQLVMKTENDSDEGIPEEAQGNKKKETIWVNDLNATANDENKEEVTLKIKKEATPEQEFLTNSVSKTLNGMKTEINIDEEHLEIVKVENIKEEETWDIELDVPGIDPLKLDESHAIGAVVKFEKGTRGDQEINSQEIISGNASKMTTEINSDHEVFRSSEGKIFFQKKLGQRKRHLCNLCGKSFARNEHLKRHLVVHTGEKPYVCDVCSKLFSRETSLRRHKILHTGEGSYRCHDCGKSFAHSYNLTRHKLIHTGERTHVCEVCSKSFTQISHLIRHKITHTGEKTYSCNVCDKAFYRKEHLKKHHLLHTGEKS